MSKHKNTLLLISLTALITGSAVYFLMNINTEKQKNTQEPPGESVASTTSSSTTEVKEVQTPETISNYKNSMAENAINEYLSNEELIIWKSKNDSAIFCSTDNLSAENDLSPYYVWAYCAEYESTIASLQKINEYSGPIKVSYPNELSYYDPSKFSVEVPQTGDNHQSDIKKIFPQELQQVIETYQTERIISENEHEAFENIQNWNEMKELISSCQVDTIFQAHNRHVTAQLKDGTELKTTEPNIDDVIQLAIQAETQCDPILITTE